MENDWDSFVSDLILKHDLERYLPKQFIDELDIIRRLSNVPGLCERLRAWLQAMPNIRSGEEDKSNKLRERGNDIFKSKQNNHLALLAYSKAIFDAPAGSKALALGHANRAVVLIRFSRYREAFDDCQLALDGGYPEANRAKIYFRQAESAGNLNDADKLSSVIEGISALAARRELSKAELQKLQQLKDQHRIMASSAKEALNTANENHSPLPALKDVENLVVGRHVVAIDPIQENHIIARETAVSFVPVYDPETRSTLAPFDCQKCASVNIVPFPCSSCGRAFYCSSKCRNDHNRLHRTECVGYQKHLWYAIGIAHLGIRCFLDGFDAIQDEISRAIDSSSLFHKLMKATEQATNSYGQYARVLRLVTNFENMDPSDVLHYSLAGLMLAVYLQNFTEFFTENFSPQNCMDPFELFVFCGALILRHIGQLVCNGHAISEIRATLPNVADCLEEEGMHLKPGLLHRYFRSSRAFTAIFPSISMFNHSCDPNIRNHFEGSTLTVFATRSIAAGEEILNCYGPNYRMMPTRERRMQLQQQYRFVCKCNRCSAGDDSTCDIYDRIKCPMQACGREFTKALEAKDLAEAFQCLYCRGEISCGWYERILNIVEDNQEYVKPQFQQCLNAYEESKRTLTRFNQTKFALLSFILDRYLQYAGLDEFCLDSLKKLATELVAIRRHQFGFMSLEYIVGCFYLVDLLAIEHCRVGGKPLSLTDVEMCSILADFRSALNMLGESSRSMIMEYFREHIMVENI